MRLYPFYRMFIKYCVFSKILKYSGLLPFSVFPRCQCVYTHQAGRTPAPQQSSEKSQNLKEKNTIFNEHPVGDRLFIRIPNKPLSVPRHEMRLFHFLRKWREEADYSIFSSCSWKTK